MYTHLLLPTDGSDFAAQGVAHGVSLAAAIAARVTAVVVTEPYIPIARTAELSAILSERADEINATAAAAAAQRLKAVSDQAAAAGVACDTLHVQDLRPADGILGAAQDHGCDLIVMSSHSRRGVQRVFLGSQAFEVVTRSRVPVLIVRAHERDVSPQAVGSVGRGTYSRILIASDGSQLADKALEQGLGLAKHVGASVTLVVASGLSAGVNLAGIGEVDVWSSTGQVSKATAKAAEAILQRCAERAAAAGVVHELVHVKKQVASDAILVTAEKYKCDLIVMGSHGYRGMDRLLLGSQAYDVVGRAQMPVLIVK